MNSSLAFRIAAGFGFAAVALGAFGAHSLRPVLEANHQMQAWQTAANYHLVHAIVLLVVASLRPLNRCAWWTFAAGTLIFSGSLYILAVTNITKLGAVTPVGGVCLLVGWVLLAIRGSGNEGK